MYGLSYIHFFILHQQLLSHCFNGIQNIMMMKKLPNIELGTLFAAVRVRLQNYFDNDILNCPEYDRPKLYVL